MIKHTYLFLIAILFVGTSCSKDSESSVEKTYVIDNAAFHIRSDKQDAQATTDGMNRAIEQAKAEGYTVVKLMPGDYLIDCVNDASWYPTKGVFVPTNMTLDLTGARLHVAPNQSNHYAVLQIDHVENATVVGGHIIGDRAQHDKTHIQGYGIQIIASRNVTLQDVRVEAVTGDGIILTTYTYMHFFGRFPSKNVKITGCDISDCGRQGIHVVQASGIEIGNNQLHDITGGTHQYAIDVNPNGAWQSIVEDVKIHHNTFRNCTNGSMRLWGGTDIEVYDNRMENLGLFSVSPQRVRIYRNTLTDNGTIYIAKESVDICVPIEGNNKNTCLKLTDLSTRTPGFSCF